MKSLLFIESIVEDASLAWLEVLGYAVLHSPDMSPTGDTFGLILPQGEMEDFTYVMLKNRLRQGQEPLNPALPEGV